MFDYVTFNVIYYILSQIFYKKNWVSIRFFYISRARFIQFADPFENEIDNIPYYVKYQSTFLWIFYCSTFKFRFIFYVLT